MVEPPSLEYHCQTDSRIPTRTEETRRHRVSLACQAINRSYFPHQSAQYDPPLPQSFAASFGKVSVMYLVFACHLKLTSKMLFPSVVNGKACMQWGVWLPGCQDQKTNSSGIKWAKSQIMRIQKKNKLICFFLHSTHLCPLMTITHFCFLKLIKWRVKILLLQTDTSIYCVSCGEL